VTRLASICALAALALLGTACGERQEPTGPIAQTYPVSVHGAGDRPTVLKQRPERIVALDAGVTGTLVAIGAGGRVVGVPDGMAKGPASKAVEVVRQTGQVDVDAVAAAKPDLIVATPNMDELDVARAGREANAAVYVLPSNSISSVEEGTIDLGFLVDEAARARQLVGKIEQQVAEVDDRLADVAPTSVFVDTGFFITVPERSLLGDLVVRARGTNVAGERPGPGPFPLAALVRANPDVYLATSDAGVTIAALKDHPQLAKLRAVKKRRVEIVPVELVTRSGPRIGEGLMAVARALHPDAFR
jgi:iron complex transport system substrate-binding protein